VIRHKSKLTLVPLAAATFFMVSGGPFGIEEVIQSSGYKLGMALLCLIPLVWSLPTGLMVGELSAAIPAEGGFYIWVGRALGPFWGFQEAWLSLTASIFDMAAYPAVFVLSLGQILPTATQGHNGVLISAAVIAACMIWNLFGARAVGAGSILLGVLLLSPFVVITLIAILRHPALAAATASASRAHPDLLAGVLVAMWNYMGWDNASTVAGEVENPQRTYPRVMILALVAIVAAYVIPVVAVWSTHVQPAFWSTGSWAAIASLVGGPWLGIALVVGVMISTVGMVNSLTMSYSRLPFAMAEDGYAPRLLTRRLSNGAPWVSIVACGSAWMLALGMSFDRLLMLDILLYGASLVLEFIALVVLRISEPALNRPFTIPGGVVGAILAGVGPTALLIVAAIKNRNEQIGHISALGLGLILMATGVVCYFVVAKMKHRRHTTV